MRSEIQESGPPGRYRDIIRGNIPALPIVFSLTFLILFLGMNRAPNFYDEGIVLTGAMRVAAGQLPHRDFYAIYGPAQFYMLAGLFKIFGPSLLAERLLDVFYKSLLATMAFSLILSYSRRIVALVSVAVLVCVLLSLYDTAGIAVVPVSLINLAALITLLHMFERPPSQYRLLAAGALAGVDTLFRYDAGIALFGVELLALAIAAWMTTTGPMRRLRAFVPAFALCFAGFVMVVIPAVAFYLARAPMSDFLYDIVIFPSRYYRSARSLPFPQLSLVHFNVFADYLPIPILLCALYALLSGRLGSARGRGARGFIVVFALLTFAMYFKGLIRLSALQLYLCTIPSLLLLAVLFEHRFDFAKPVRLFVNCLVVASVAVALRSAAYAENRMYSLGDSVPGHLLREMRGRQTPEERVWCRRPGPLTAGFCFEPEIDRLQTIEYIDSHTTADQPLLVGLDRHDKVYANDNIIYFASQRLPVTKWSEFDADLQNRADIQTEMIRELEGKMPPYIVRDSEFDTMNEPNDSSKSSGVTLLDYYIQSHYKPVETFGVMSVWQRLPRS